MFSISSTLLLFHCVVYAILYKPKIIRNHIDSIYFIFCLIISYFNYLSNTKQYFTFPKNKKITFNSNFWKVGYKDILNFSILTNNMSVCIKDINFTSTIFCPANAITDNHIFSTCTKKLHAVPSPDQKEVLPYFHL